MERAAETGSDKAESLIVTEVDKSNESTPPERSGSSTYTHLQPRRSIMSIASETIRYIEKAEKDKSLNVRTDDKRSVIFMSISFVIGITFTIMYMVNPAMRPVCIVLALVSDLFLGLSILWYVLLRFGVLRSVEQRHALLCWQLMLGAGALFAFYTMNIAFAFFTVYSSTNSPAQVETESSKNMTL